MDLRSVQGVQLGRERTAQCVQVLRDGASMSGYMRCGKCRLYIDRTGTSRFTRVCQCAGTLEVSVRAHIRAFVRFDKRPLWQRALERRRREKLWTVPDWYVDPTNATSLARDEPGLKVSLGDLARRRG